MQEFSLTLMKDIVEYCGKTTTKASEEIHTMQKEIDESFDAEDKKIIKETITTNETTRLTNLRRNKQKKFNYLKYKRNNHNINYTNINYTEKQRQAPIQHTDTGKKKMERSIQKNKSNQHHARTTFYNIYPPPPPPKDID